MYATPTPAVLAQSMRADLNAQLRFRGSSARILNLRCITIARNEFQCRGLTSVGLALWTRVTFHPTTATITWNAARTP